ncbi:MAG: hypothetical protein ACKOE2_15615, partial [Actinomycetales bacterium]
MPEDLSASSRPARVLSGIQPTADAFHIGNYLGALREWVRMQEGNDAYYVVVDQHAITVDHDPALLRRRTLLSFAQLLAVGLDPGEDSRRSRTGRQVFGHGVIVAEGSGAFRCACLRCGRWFDRLRGDLDPGDSPAVQLADLDVMAVLSDLVPQG